ncbi:MAG: transposase [Candidatus Omnitrophica bacterium]|nr:transposase [Candidatus Omnitrophota bacterium]MBU1933370.1 transposase [Candidatus Omnitrophota bacterium]
MPRIARVVAVGYPHHITQRGNYGQVVFRDDIDKERYLAWIGKYSDKYGLPLLVDSLMPTHVHFIGIPLKEDSLAKTFNAAHMRYSQYFNNKMKTKGHLWQGRFYSCALDENHLIAAARYIERNPVRAKLVNKPWEWKWSSASVHIGADNAQLLELKNLFEIIDIPQGSWRSFIDREDDRSEMEIIKKSTFTGRPLGDEQFIKKLEKKLGKRLQALSVGRPRIIGDSDLLSPEK